jgi:Arabinose-binding domain of AraC transcription regulator, N-term
MTTEKRAAAKLAGPTINLASLVYGLDAYMRSRGADAGNALRRTGLEPGDLTDPDRRVPLIRYLELLKICADLLADPQFGLKFGASTSRGTSASSAISPWPRARSAKPSKRWGAICPPWSTPPCTAWKSAKTSCLCIPTISIR